MYNLKCSVCNYSFEEIISYHEADESIQIYGKVVIECPSCKTYAAEKDGEIQLTSKMGLSWAESTWGKTDNEK